MLILDNKKEAMKIAAKNNMAFTKVEGGWAVMEWRDYIIWRKQK